MKNESDINVHASAMYRRTYNRKCCISLLDHCVDADNTTHVPRIENLQEVTTVNDSLRNVVAFSFDLFTGDVNISSADNSAIFQLRWETANKGTSGLITPTVTKGRGFNQTNHTTEGAVTYHFTVDATALGEGPLLVTLSAKMHCSRYRSSYCNRKPHSGCICSQWQYGAESETIKIGAKKGKSRMCHASQLQLLYHSQGMILLQWYRVVWSQTIHFKNIHKYTLYMYINIYIYNYMEV